jgi:CRISPR-associated protein Cst2
MNLFATVLTYPAPTANYRGESELNRAVMQKITDGRFDYPIISPEAMRNALREILAGKYKLECKEPRQNNLPNSLISDEGGFHSSIRRDIGAV